MHIAKRKQPSQRARTLNQEASQPAPSQRAPPTAVRSSQSCTCGGGCPRCNRRERDDLGSLRAPMESVFRSEFSAVRVHRDGLADAQNARAVTIGEEIHLSKSEQDLTASSGRELIGHELAHVLQQRRHQGAIAPQATLESEADRAGAAAAAGHRFNVREGAAPGHAQRKPKVAPAPPSGGILYVGMNNADPEIKALQDRYKAGSPVDLTIIKGTNEAAATEIGTGTAFDLTTDPGIDAIAKALTSDTAKQAALKTLLKSQEEHGNRDDLAHVAKVYASTEADGKDRMTRVVLSGHSGGAGVLGRGGEVYFNALVDLGKIFPKAANQTKHLIVAACQTGSERNVLDYYVQAYPNLLTVWAWLESCPTGPGAVSAITKWAELTEHGQTTLPRQDSGIAIWSGGVYSGGPSGKAPAATVLASIRANDARFEEYFNGIRADPDPHGWLETYYRRASTAARRSDITGSDHDEMEQKRQRALLLRFWKPVAKNFWTKNGPTIKKGYGSASVPDYANLSRKDTILAIAMFLGVSTAGAAEKLAAWELLNGLRLLEPKPVPDSMIIERN